MYVGVVHVCGTLSEEKMQEPILCCLLLPCVVHGQNSGHQAWPQASFLTGPSCQPNSHLIFLETGTSLDPVFSNGWTGCPTVCPRLLQPTSQALTDALHHPGFYLTLGSERRSSCRHDRHGAFPQPQDIFPSCLLSPVWS